MELSLAIIEEKTINTLVLKPLNIKTGYGISCINENGIRVYPEDSNLLTSEGVTIMFFKEGFLDTVLGLYKVGDKIPVEIKQLKD